MLWQAEVGALVLLERGSLDGWQAPLAWLSAKPKTILPVLLRGEWKAAPNLSAEDSEVSVLLPGRISEEGRLGGWFALVFEFCRVGFLAGTYYAPLVLSMGHRT